MLHLPACLQAYNLLQVSTKLLDHLISRSTTAYQQGMQDGPTKQVILNGCSISPGAGPSMSFVEHCLRRCPQLEVLDATGFGGISGAFHLSDLLVLLRTLNKMRPAPQVLHFHLDSTASAFAIRRLHINMHTNEYACSNADICLVKVCVSVHSCDAFQQAAFLHRVMSYSYIWHAMTACGLVDTVKRAAGPGNLG